MIRNYAGNLTLEVIEVLAEGELRAARFRSAVSFQREPMSVPSSREDILVEREAFQVRYAILDHGIPCLAFALEEKAHVNVWKNKLDERGLAVGPWLRHFKQAILRNEPDEKPIRALARGALGLEPIMLSLGEIRGLAALVPGQKIAYVVDARYHAANARAIVRLVHNVDLLFIESVFLDEDREHAKRKNHLTAKQAGLLARRSQAKRMVPFHYSPRYVGREFDVYAEAERAFLGTVTKITIGL